MTALDSFFARTVQQHGLALARPNLFVLEEGGNVGLLTMTRAKYSGDGWADIVPHIAVISRRIAEATGDRLEPAFPEPFQQPWYRSAFYVHEAAPNWESLSENDEATWSGAGKDLAERVIPALREHTPDTGIRDCWREHRDPFMSEPLQFGYLALLTRDLGPVDVFQASIASLESLLRAKGAAVPGYARLRPVLRHVGIAEPSM